MAPKHKAQSKSRLVASVSRALRVIELLVAHQSHELGVTQIARQLGIGKSTAHQLLATLAAHGFVDQRDQSPRYRLGTRVMEAGIVAATHIGIGPALTPILENLVDTVGETSSIGILSSNEVVLLHRVEAESVLRVDLKVGTRLPIHNSGIGRAIMSAMPTDSRDHLLHELNLTEAERQETEAAILVVQRQGVAIVHDIPVNGINAIAVAILNQANAPIAGLVIAGPSSRFEPEKYRENALQTANLISARLGVQITI